MKPLKIKKESFVAGRKTRRRFSKFLEKTFGFFKKRHRSGSSAFSQEQADKALVYSLAPSKIPNGEQIKHLGKTLSPRENLIIKICLVVVLANLVYLGVHFYDKHVTLLPLAGGTYREGVIGYPKNINPLYASDRDVDQDLSRLIYSSLFRYDGQGHLVGDLADKIETTDNKTYVVTIKNNVKWHSGEPLTADDVVFTFNLILNPDYNSPLRDSFSSVGITKVSDYQVKFSLPSAYAAFPNLLTFGIMPQSVWQNISPESATLADLNLEPIGSGPYEFKSLTKNKSGELKEYRLAANPDYYGAKPYIKNVVFKFYPDSTELISRLNSGDVDGIAYLPLDQKHSILAQDSLNFHNLDSFQEDSIFFNSDNNANLANPDFRRALALAIDKPALVSNLFDNFYRIVDGPLPANSLAYSDKITKYNFDPAAANAKLDSLGWKSLVLTDSDLASTSPAVKAVVAYANGVKESPAGNWRYKIDKKGNVSLLTIKLSFVDESDSSAVAQKVQGYWKAVGVQTILDPVETSDISNLIASRSFEALFFGQLLGGDPDIFAFWHSSQIDGGLNISGYKNAKVDKLLENARTTTDQTARIASYQEIQKIITAELPAIFLYEKDYIYVQTKKVKGFSATAAVDTSDRFASIADWFLKSRDKFSWK